MTTPEWDTEFFAEMFLVMCTPDYRHFRDEHSVWEHLEDKFGFERTERARAMLDRYAGLFWKKYHDRIM